jgi:hypothetical protein
MTRTALDLRRPRVALVASPRAAIPAGCYGGSIEQVTGLAVALARRGYEVTVIGAGFTAGPGVGAPYRTIDTQQDEGLTDPVLAEALHGMAVERLLRRLEVDLVHDHTVAGLLSPGPASGRDVARVVTVYGPAHGPDAVPAHKLTGRDRVALVAVSEHQRAQAPGLPWLGVVHPGILVTEYPYCEEKDGSCVFVGALAPGRGADLAIVAAHAAGRSITVAGTVPQPGMETYVQWRLRPLLRPGDKLIIAADHAKRTSLLLHAPCLVTPFGADAPWVLPVVEAQACGTPVVALRGGVAGELVEDGVSGILCPTPAELAEGIAAAERLDPAGCRRHAAAHFDTTQMAAGYDRLYLQALAARHQQTPAAPPDPHPHRAPVPAGGRSVP